LLSRNNQPQKPPKKVMPGGNRQLKPSGCHPGSQQLDKSSLQPREQPPKKFQKQPERRLSQ
jgi:hypothetical protein